ncbi:MAG: ABC transporter ATP-binding protein [Rickettsiales bacterium]|jgi:ABC-2 type transport system ATP-binding protein|nr:ABC transporter ATP-binding protein [Rickettsiales bacterium]
MYPLKIANLSKSFKNQVVLDDITFEVSKGEIFGLIGLNGVGKTTLIKIILDLLKTDMGQVFLDDEVNTRVKSRRHMRYLPEKFQPSSALKGMEFLKIFNQDAKENEIYKICDLLSLDQKALTRRVSKYSKGMMQKLGLISTFLGDSKIIILDEPMSGLDPKARVSLKELFLSSKEKGKAIFFSSHILSDIDEICDRIGILNGGKISYLGTPKEFKELYKEESLEKAFLKEINKQ